MCRTLSPGRITVTLLTAVADTLAQQGFSRSAPSTYSRYSCEYASADLTCEKHPVTFGLDRLTMAWSR